MIADSFSAYTRSARPTVRRSPAVRPDVGFPCLRAFPGQGLARLRHGHAVINEFLVRLSQTILADKAFVAPTNSARRTRRIFPTAPRCSPRTGGLRQERAVWVDAGAEMSMTTRSSARRISSSGMSRNGSA